MAETPSASSGAKIYDISNDKPVLGEIPHEEVQNAVISGKYSLPKGDINVVSPEGVFGTLPAEETSDAFKGGYKYATPDMLSKQAAHVKYGTGVQQAITALEGAGQGLTGPLVPLAEQALGVSSEDIRGRQEENPVAHGLGEAGGFLGGAFTGTGEAALVGKLGEAAEAIAGSSRIAQGAARMATEMATISAGDDLTKYINDAPTSVGGSLANVGLSAAIGGLMGAAIPGLGTLARKGTEIAPEFLKDFSTEMTSLMSGGKVEVKVETTAPEMSPTHINYDPFAKKATEEAAEEAKPTAGAKAARAYYDYVTSTEGAEKVGYGAGAAVGGAAGHATGIPGLGVAGALLGGKFGSSLLPSILQPLLEKTLNPEGFQQAIKFGEAAIKGQKMINNAVDSVIKGGGSYLLQQALPDQNKLDKLDKRLTDINATPGVAMNTPYQLSHYMPNQAGEMAQSIGHVAQYMQTLKPNKTPQSPLDTPQEATKQELDHYNRQMVIAEQPLTVLNHIKGGTLQPQDVTTLKTMSPALYNTLSQKLHNAVIEHISDGGNVPYKTRQSLSLFIGQPLDSTLTQPSIAAVQSIYTPPMPMQAQNGRAPKMTEKNTSKLGKTANSYRTPEQTAEQDRSERG